MRPPISQIGLDEFNQRVHLRPVMLIVCQQCREMPGIAAPVNRYCLSGGDHRVLGLEPNNRGGG